MKVCNSLFPAGAVIYGFRDPVSLEMAYVGATRGLKARLPVHYHARPFLRRYQVVIIRLNPRNLFLTEDHIIKAFKRRFQCHLNSNRACHCDLTQITPQTIQSTDGNCPECSNPMPDKRAGALYCSDACRMKAHRKRHRDPNAKRGRPPKQKEAAPA